jgi:hypothetical protein
MKKSKSLLYSAPIFLTLAACSGGTKHVLNQSPTQTPQVARNESSPTPTPEAAPKIGIIQETKYFHDCGTSLQLPEDYKSHKDKYVFDADLGEFCRLNIDGRDVDLKMRNSAGMNRELKVGDRYNETYGGDDLKARVDYVVTGVCDSNDESCEVTYIDATITVERHGSKQQIKARGLFGC